MESTKENIECVNLDGQTKFFSAKQLEHIGKSANGSYDGWLPKADKPAGIPDKVVIGDSDDKTGSYDPNGGTTVNYIQSNPNGISTPADQDATGASNSGGGTGDGTAATDAANTGDAGTADAREGTQSTGTSDTAKTEGGENGNTGTGDAGSSSTADAEGDSKDGSETGDDTKGTGDTKPAEKVNKTGNKPGQKPKADNPADTPQD